MSCREKDQSAIAEVRDQLMLDTADEVRLDVVTSNLGLDRPSLGIDDDEWRALVKAIGIQPKSIRNAFYRIMDICAGPQKTRVFNLQDQSEITDRIIVITNAENLVQLGSVIIDPGLSSEEEASFCYRDLVTGKVFFGTPLTQVHVPVLYATSNLSVAAPIGSTSLVLDDTSLFQTTGFPVPAIVDQGNTREELIVITAIDTGTNTLTLQSATTKEHIAPRSTFVQKPLYKETFAGRDFIELGDNATRVFPSTGFVRIDFAEAEEETREYVSNSVSTNTIHLRGVLAFDHSVNASVELVTPGSAVTTVNGVQRGVNWEIQETEPRKVKILVPKSLISHRLIDLSFLHDVSPPVFATTLALPAVGGNTTITVADATGFRQPVGAVYINGTENYVTEFSSISGNVLTLTGPLTQSFGAGSPVEAARVNYTGTELEEGNLRLADGSVDPGYGFKPEFSGPYVYDATSWSPSLVKAFLSENIPPSAFLVVAQGAAHTAIEVDDASMWPAPPFDPFRARVGIGTGFFEDVTVVDVAYAISTTTTMAVSATAGDLTITGADTSLFPESSDGTHAAGYRVRIGAGTANEEIVYVAQNTTGTNTLTLVSFMVNSHAIGEAIDLVSDVLTTTVLTKPHQTGVRVDKLTNTIKLDNTAMLPASGTVWLNFGKGKPNARARVVHVTPTTLIMTSTDAFPINNYNYRVLVGEGTVTAEFAQVTFNDTSLSTLSFVTPLINAHVRDEYVEFKAGTPTALQYVAKDSDSIILSTETVLDSLHVRGEAVHLSPGNSVPSPYGFDYPLKLPPSPIRCFVALIDLVRAAGVEVVLIEKTV